MGKPIQYPESIQAVDPVCGMKVSADCGLKYRFEDIEYRFCSESCKQKFQADPAQYLGADL